MEVFGAYVGRGGIGRSPRVFLPLPACLQVGRTGSVRRTADGSAKMVFHPEVVDVNIHDPRHPAVVALGSDGVLGTVGIGGGGQSQGNKNEQQFHLAFLPGNSSAHLILPHVRVRPTIECIIYHKP